MRKLPEESYDQWLERIARTETERAIRQYICSKDLEMIMQEMSDRILKKCLDPLYKSLKEIPFDKEK